jgi:hypothetical protein
MLKRLRDSYTSKVKDITKRRLISILITSLI